MCASTTARTDYPGGRIRTLIADDEPLARELMSQLVRRDPDLELLGATASGAETLTAVQEFKPQLLLLDIQMPSLDGISVAEQLASKDSSPYIIFVTAHDEFALQAFEVAVRDYLVKPVSKQRFAAAIQRAKREIGAEEMTNRSGKAEPLIVRNGDMLVSLLPDDVIWVEAANQYVRLHTAAGDKLMVSQSLRRFARTALAASFIRVHRSTLINPDHLVAVQSGDNRYKVQLSDRSLHDIARSRRALVPSLLAQARANAS